ncbi:hypothetical protein Tsubulata_001771 [Turnera subulata]|uniref:Exostosin GT47 domain-containing protein n=1 Tax=Turnera subulata TaxID=218843 RepID=A0A9Q0FGH7_9ROSI|nr:hypothetical protein Tsubulata_001771 [Turnera subulata]
MNDDCDTTANGGDLLISPSPSPSPQNLTAATSNSRTRKEEKGNERIEDGLARARFAIRKAAKSHNYSSYKEGSYLPTGAIYRNPYAFHQSHTEMEKRFKVWIYKEGEPPIFHYGPAVDIYSIEGQFIAEMESGESNFIARNPEEANMFLIPISVAHIIKFLYRPLVTYSRAQLQRVVIDYIQVLSDKYPYWNRSKGADHFLGPDISKGNPDFYKHFIRVLCNANTSEMFQPNRDVSIPEIKTLGWHLGLPEKGVRPSKRSILAFFAGGVHGEIRRVLLEYWKDRDVEIQVHEYLDKKQNYFKLMGQSKFCLCPSGYEVASPREVTAIQLGCVPVIISNNYSLPFSDVLDWSKFTVQIPPEKIPEIKTILKGISQRRYLTLQKRVQQVRRHFVLNRPAQPYDMLYMLLHSVWLRRLNVRLPY